MIEEILSGLFNFLTNPIFKTRGTNFEFCTYIQLNNAWGGVKIILYFL